MSLASPDSSVPQRSPVSLTPDLTLSLPEQEWLPLLLSKVRALRFGTIQLKVHESQVVVLETVEQTRFELPSKSKR
jgi:hypothetical protein